MISRFFPGVREELAAIDDEVVAAALGPTQPGKAHCFEDQYLSTGGQLFELMAGHDRFVSDLRPLMQPVLAKRGQALGLCCHPYDICTALIAKECGVIVTDVTDNSLAAQQGIEREDVITEVDGKPVTDVKTFREALNKADPKRGVLLYLDRKGSKTFAVLKAGGAEPPIDR